MPRAAEFDLSVQVEAKIDRLEKQMKRADTLVDRQFRSMERRAETAAGRFERSMSKAASGMQTRLAGLGKGFLIGTAGVLGVQSGREIARYADEYRGLQNSLRDAGREGKDLTKTFGDLFRIAQDQGAALGSLVGLYRDAAAAGDVLNATEADRLKFAEGVANALRIEGRVRRKRRGRFNSWGSFSQPAPSGPKSSTRSTKAPGRSFRPLPMAWKRPVARSRNFASLSSTAKCRRKPSSGPSSPAPINWPIARARPKDECRSPSTGSATR